LQGAQYRIGEGDWTAIDADDGIWDSAFEHFRFTLDPEKPGEHVVEVRVGDVAGNVQTGRITVKIP
jgi:hypothetical protein